MGNTTKQPCTESWEHAIKAKLRAHDGAELGKVSNRRL